MSRKKKENLDVVANTEDEAVTTYTTEYFPRVEAVGALRPFYVGYHSTKAAEDACSVTEWGELAARQIFGDLVNDEKVNLACSQLVRLANWLLALTEDWEAGLIEDPELAMGVHNAYVHRIHKWAKAIPATELLAISVPTKANQTFSILLRRMLDDAEVQLNFDATTV